MRIVVFIFGLILVLAVLMEAFEAVILPRRVTRRFRFSRFYYRNFWQFWRSVVVTIRPRGRLRETLLSWFGPLSLLGLFGIWFAGLIVGFGLMLWSLETPVHAEQPPGLGDYLYLSGVTFFTLGFGDITPTGPGGRILAVLETGLGFGVLALMISYFPVLYQAFSAREVSISMLDARAGSPPSVAQLLLRAPPGNQFQEVIDPLLREYEHWSASVLESHLSFPVLSYYRSQHDNQSWLGALTMMLDTCALLLTGLKGHHPYQTQLTFAMARHVAVDLSLVFQVPPLPAEPDRLPADALARLREKLRQAGLEFRADAAADAQLVELRKMYEPFVNALAHNFVLALPAIDPDHVVDNWQTSAWMRRVPGIAQLPAKDPGDDHFD